MLLQCPVCRLNARVPRELEGTAVECPRCKAVGYAGRRPGGLANLQPIPEPAETAAVCEFFRCMEEELAGPLPEELFGPTLQDVAFYDLPGEPPYEDMLREELEQIVKKSSASAAMQRQARMEPWVRREVPRVPAREALAAVNAHRDMLAAQAACEDEGFTQRRACPRVEAAELAADIEHGGRLLLSNISVSGMGVDPQSVNGLAPGDRIRLRLVHSGDDAGCVPQELLKELGPLTARLVRVDDGGAGLAFENLNGPSNRRLAGLVARLAKQRNESNVPNIQEAQGF